jgi:hypothetical protein
MKIRMEGSEEGYRNNDRHPTDVKTHSYTNFKKFVFSL